MVVQTLSKEKIFTELVEKKYKWLIYKIRKRRILHERAQEIVNDSIAFFWKHHISRFDYSRTGVDLESPDIITTRKQLKSKAKTYFLHRIFEYMSQGSFYWQKFIQDLEEERERDLTYSYNFRAVNDMMYSNDMYFTNIETDSYCKIYSEFVEYNTGSLKEETSSVISNTNKHNLQAIYDIEEKEYVKQLIYFVMAYNLKDQTKDLLVKYLQTLNENVFKDFNITYYKNKLKTIKDEFDCLGIACAH
ncbi:MAG: hypothetical protein ABSG25_07135 [Bryobacteraceae bacterium]